MKIVLLDDACIPDGIDELGIPWKRGDPQCFRPGDFAVMPLDRMAPDLKKRYNLRAVISCCDDPVKAIRRILAKDVIVIGRATREELPPNYVELFGRVCYVKCDAVDHKDPKYMCTNSVAWYKKHRFLYEHNRACKVFFPEKHEKGRALPYEKAPKGVPCFGCDSQYARVRHLKLAAPGWLTTGLATAFHFLFDGVLPGDSYVYMFRFSHWRGGQVVRPPPGMQNAFGRPPGRHNVDVEQQAAQYLQDTGRVFSFELVDVDPIQPASVVVDSKNAPLLVREDIARLIPKGGVAVELGVAKGQFSKKLLDRSEAAVLYSIDAWSGAKSHDTIEFNGVVRLLKPYGERSRIIRSTFEAAAKRFDDEFFDFVYVDGFADTGQENGATLEQWWPKLRPGGVFAGDDYDVRAWPKVVRVVDAFAKKVGCNVSVIRNSLADRPADDRDTMYNKYPTWYFYKPARPVAEQNHEEETRSVELPVMTDARRSVCELIEKRFGNTPPLSMLDIGGGLGLEAEYFQKKYGTEVWIIEGNASNNTASQTRTTKYGPASTFKFSYTTPELLTSYNARGMRVNLVTPSGRSKVPPVDLVISLGACGTYFPVSEYRSLMKSCEKPGTRIFLELNANQKADQLREGVVITASLQQRPKSSLCEVRLL